MKKTNKYLKPFVFFLLLLTIILFGLLIFSKNTEPRSVEAQSQPSPRNLFENALPMEGHITIPPIPSKTMGQEMYPGSMTVEDDGLVTIHVATSVKEVLSDGSINLYTYRLNDSGEVCAETYQSGDHVETIQYYCIKSDLGERFRQFYKMHAEQYPQRTKVDQKQYELLMDELRNMGIDVDTAMVMLFNEAGELVHYFINDYYDGWIKWMAEYDASGRRVKTYLWALGTFFDSTYSYNENGKETQKNETHGYYENYANGDYNFTCDDSFDSTTYYIYDKENKLIQIDEDSPYYDCFLTYDEQGRLIRRETFQKNGNSLQCSRYAYDSSGKIDYHLFFLYGKYSSKDIYEYTTIRVPANQVDYLSTIYDFNGIVYTIDETPAATTVPEETIAESENVTLYLSTGYGKTAFQYNELGEIQGYTYDGGELYNKFAYIKGDLGDRMNQAWKEVYEEYVTSGQYTTPGHFNGAKIDALEDELRSLLEDRTILREGTCVFLNEDGLPVHKSSYNYYYAKDINTYWMAEYNTDGKLSKVTYWYPEEAGGIWISSWEKTFTYDENGNLISVETNGVEKHKTNYIYDGGKLVQTEVTDLWGSTEDKTVYKYVYDNLGTVAEIQRYKNNELEGTTEITYTAFEVSREQAEYLINLYDFENACTGAQIWCHIAD